MESLANVLERYQGKMVEVVTNGGQKLSGTVEAAHEDFFTLSAVTRLYVVPYTGVSTLLFPSERGDMDLRRQITSYSEIESPAKPSRRKVPERKESKRARRSKG